MATGVWKNPYRRGRTPSRRKATRRPVPHIKESGSKVIRKVIKIEHLSRQKLLRIQKGLRKVGIPSHIKKNGLKTSLQLSPSFSVRKSIKENKHLSKMAKGKSK